jgi:hypothetical protein
VILKRPKFVPEETVAGSYDTGHRVESQNVPGIIRREKPE